LLSGSVVENVKTGEQTRIRADGLFVYRRGVPGAPVLRQEVDLDPLGTDVLFAAPRLLAVSGAMPWPRVSRGMMPKRRCRITSVARCV